MPKETEKIPTKIYYDPHSVARRTKQIAYEVEQHDKTAMLTQILNNNSDKQTVIITKSKRKADEINVYLKTQNINSTAVHGNHRADQLETAAKAFNEGKLNTLITTDMILQTLNLTNIQQLINYNLPSEQKQYFSRVILLKEVGTSYLFVSSDEQNYFDAIEFVLKQEIPQEEVKDFTPSPLSLKENKQKEKRTKPRHRKMKAKKETK
ncbi:MAG: DEAD/DEAH box helicase [Thiovulaceae bacterium]|nr:DEAD/DEAH box helicase [Sulfurimonadaceae bacterium]